jgi:hypothetical protein
MPLRALILYIVMVIRGAAQKLAIVRTFFFFSEPLGWGICCHLRCDVCAIAFSNYGSVDRCTTISVNVTAWCEI